MKSNKEDGVVISKKIYLIKRGYHMRKTITYMVNDKIKQGKLSELLLSTYSTTHLGILMVDK